jgi:hypothetical protein
MVLAPHFSPATPRHPFPRRSPAIGPLPVWEYAAAPWASLLTRPVARRPGHESHPAGQGKRMISCRTRMALRALPSRPKARGPDAKHIGRIGVASAWVPDISDGPWPSALYRHNPGTIRHHPAATTIMANATIATTNNYSILRSNYLLPQSMTLTIAGRTRRHLLTSACSPCASANASPPRHLPQHGRCLQPG